MGAVFTGDKTIELGIYQSSCSCCTAITVIASSALPACRTCGAAVEWRLVQPITLDVPAPSWTLSGRSSSPPRQQMDSQNDV